LILILKFESRSSQERERGKTFAHKSITQTTPSAKLILATFVRLQQGVQNSIPPASMQITSSLIKNVAERNIALAVKAFRF